MALADNVNVRNITNEHFNHSPNVFPPDIKS